MYLNEKIMWHFSTFIPLVHLKKFSRQFWRTFNSVEITNYVIKSLETSKIITKIAILITTMTCILIDALLWIFADHGNPMTSTERPRGEKSSIITPLNQEWRSLRRSPLLFISDVYLLSVSATVSRARDLDLSRQDLRAVLMICR